MRFIIVTFIFVVTFGPLPVSSKQVEKINENKFKQLVEQGEVEQLTVEKRADADNKKVTLKEE